MSDTAPNSPYDDEGQLTAGGGPAPDAREKPMGFLDHLEELRGTLIKCAIVFALFVTVIAYRLEDAETLLAWPMEQAKSAYPHLKMEIVTNSPMSVFTVVINICLVGGVILALPFWIYFLSRFVAPALNDRELRVIVPAGLSAFALFLAGAAFGYYVLMPSTIRVALELNELLGYTVMWTADKYYSMLMWLVLGMGAAFEFPLLVVLAVYLGLVEVATLRKYRRHAIVVIFIIAAIVTPTPDPLNQALLALPLIVLYELAIVVASRITARRHARG
ncbi:MAG TPA: twin-arginine translocase subunit TatC [Acidobacteriota bacterium]|nr:twin-arginine translocase subunit TatC [Acidobacteriota bacterium]